MFWVILALCGAVFLLLPLLESNDSEALGSSLVMFGGIGCNVMHSLVIFSGGVCMARRRCHAWSMSTAILALIPLGYCYLLLLPFGIWAIVVLRRPEVREAFERGAFGPR
jgi:hypothetical protein